MKAEKGIKWVAGAATALMVLAFASSIFFWNTSGTLKKEKMEMSRLVDSLSQHLSGLQIEVDSLVGAYQELAVENESLKGSVADASKAVSEKDEQLLRIRRQSQRDLKGLRAEIEQMKQFKVELEAMVATLMAENDELKEDNARLQQELAQARNENDALQNRVDDLEADNLVFLKKLEKFLPAGIRASAFSVEVEKRNEKLTVKGKRAREVEVSFDLVDVPEEMQGMQTIYLSLVNAKGVPVKTANNQNIQLPVMGEMLSFESQLKKEINLTKSQRMRLKLPLEEKMKAGYYRVNVYSDKGFLGSVNFRLQ